jgi:hypothetical protein
LLLFKSWKILEATPQMEVNYTRKQMFLLI